MQQSTDPQVVLNILQENLDHIPPDESFDEVDDALVKTQKPDEPDH
ncbi:MAG: hypothetical protein AAFV90_19615 [Cyanobacteria bacterium J06634_5]